MWQVTTAREEMLRKGRPYGTRPTWELRNMVKALSMMTWRNTPEDWTRKAEAERELMLRRKGGRS